MQPPATVTLAVVLSLFARHAEDYICSLLTSSDLKYMDHEPNTLKNNTFELKVEKVEVKVNQLENNVSKVATTCALESERQQDHGRCVEMYNRCKEDVDNSRDESGRKLNDTLDEVNILSVGQQSFEKTMQQNQGRVLILMVVLGTGEFVIFVVLMNALKKLKALKTPTTSDEIKHGMEADPRSGGNSSALQESVTIVSFNDDRKAAHREMMKDIIKDLQTEFIRISRKEEALQIKSRVAVLFVERNDRHIILESEQEIGDLRVSCVRNILKPGGKVIVVYCGHKESENLGDLLCSPSLKSADWHKELRSLKDQNCFLSINKAFSQTQKEHLKKKITEYLTK